MALIFNLVLFAIFFIISWKFINRKKLGKAPKGPFPLPLLGNALSFGKAPYLAVKKWADQYGKIFQMYIGNDRHIVLSDLELIKKAFQHPSFQGRPRMEIMEFDGASQGIILTTGQEWQDQRRFTLRHLRDFGFGKNYMEGLIEEEVDELLDWLKSQGSSPVSLNFKFSLAVVNSLWRIITGKRFNQCDPKLLGIFENMFLGTHPSSSFHGSMGETSLSAVALDLFQAGAFTTSTTLTWAVLFLILHLDVQEKLQKEIDDIVGPSRRPSMADKPKMVYTEALTCE
ncbi:unnamed protein product, partial [Allacma fusca]